MEESKEEREARENYEWAMGYERTVGYELENARTQRRLAFKRYRDLMAIKAGLEPASLTETASSMPIQAETGPTGTVVMRVAK